MEWLKQLDPGVLALLIPIVAILVGGAYAITTAIIQHRERMAMIDAGLDPRGKQGEEQEA